MQRYAHSLPTQDVADWEILSVHLKAVAALAGRFAAKFNMETWGRNAGLLHDIGKNSDAFQRYIRGKGPSPDHSTAGAVVALERYKDAGALLAFIIAGHHAGLADGVDLAVRLKKPLADYAGWEAHTGPLVGLAPLSLRRGEYKGFCLAFATRMLFSCLVDADFLETERFYGVVERGSFFDIVALRDRLRAYMAGLPPATSPLNQIRAQILAHAVGRAACPPGIFSMTVPTGGGKTLASLSFALEHASQHRLRRVIYVVPYTAIIEQTAQVFRDALSSNGDVLEHHGNFDWEPEEEAAGEADRDGLTKLRRATENWDAPVIVTTAVQFFESLFANRTSRCRKLHNIARSVVILDEVQTLPLGLLRPCMAALEEFALNYDTSIVLCTATQPALRKIDNALPVDKLKRPQGFDIGPERELAPDPEGLYVRLKRVTVEVLSEPVPDTDIAVRFAERAQMLCIVNTRRHARDLFDLIRTLPGARHLTTLMCPAHRRKVLEEVKADLKAEKPVRLVATSLVEAGVDFSFPEVWRAETGLDSIAQAAGRCNREGLLTYGKVVVFTPADHKLPIAFKVFRDSARFALQMPEPLSLPAVQRYFQELYFNRGYEALDNVSIDGRTGILPAIGRAGLNLPFASIADGFRLIEDSMRGVIVPWNAEADGALAALRGADIPPGWAVRKLQQYTVGIPQAAWQAMIATGAIQAINSEFGDRFMILENPSLYDDRTGLWADDPTFMSSATQII